MTSYSGNILKMKTSLDGTRAQYALPIGDELIDMNSLVGKNITLKFDGLINDVVTGEKIKKSYNNGYSYQSLMKLAQCDICIVKPELCHYDKGTCREPKWGETHCLIPHYVYLSYTSDLKVGITRHVNVPSRWIDQGATMALPILQVKDRLTSGLIEIELAKEFKDKTNWRKMLKGEGQDDKPSLKVIAENIFEHYGDLLDDMDAQDLDEEVVEIDYPVNSLPEKISSLGFDKTPEVSGVLVGIKGQYLIFDHGVLNVRKHQGYFIEINY